LDCVLGVYITKCEDRIEALTAERDEALNQLDSARHSVDVLEKRVAFVEGERRKSFQGLLKVTKIHDEVEAKLSKAVEALRDLTNAFAKKVDVDQTRWKTPYEHPLSAYDRAVAFLKGENP
jgi:predicted  nucleic acid-binding Zn-ribbon protein